MQLKKYCLWVVLILVLAEFSVLLTVRNYHPGGIAPAIVVDELPDFIDNHSESDWIYCEIATLEAIKRSVEDDTVDLSDLTDVEIARILRDWVRMKAPEMSMEVRSKDPREVLELMESGLGANCYPRAILLSAALTAFGVRARNVDFMSVPGNFRTAHSTVEFFDGEKWVIQDPTFNSMPVNESGEGLGAMEVQKYYETGDEVTWLQDATVLDPKIEDYRIPPDELTNVVIYHLHGYPTDMPKLLLIWMRFQERLSGTLHSMIIARDGFPIPNFILNGTIDRILLVLALLFLVLDLLPVRQKSSNE